MDNKTIVIEITFRMLRQVRQDYTPENTNSWLNESSHCLANELHDLMIEEASAGSGCCFTCHRAEAKYLRDATPGDIIDLTPEKSTADVDPCPLCGRGKAGDL